MKSAVRGFSPTVLRGLLLSLQSVTNYCVTALNSNYSLDLDFLIMSNPNLAWEKKLKRLLLSNRVFLRLCFNRCTISLET